MMLLSGHTMGTPDKSLKEAAVLFSEIGMQGIEIIFQDDYKCGFNWNTSNRDVHLYKELLDSLELKCSCVVSYASDYNHLEERFRKKALNNCQRCIEIAEILNSPFIRIYGGTFLDHDCDFDIKRRILVNSMQELAETAGSKNVSLVIENHFNTMTTGPEITNEIVSEINRKNVGILYDQANISFMKCEDFEKSIEIQKEKIFYVHVKDFIFKDARKSFSAGSVSHVSEEDRTVSSRVIGEGELPWKNIINKLDSIGYTGYLSLEYERRWHPDDLPPAEQGMKSGALYLNDILSEL